MVNPEVRTGICSNCNELLAIKASLINADELGLSPQAITSLRLRRQIGSTVFLDLVVSNMSSCPNNDQAGYDANACPVKQVTDRALEMCYESDAPIKAQT